LPKRRKYIGVGTYKYRKDFGKVGKCRQTTNTCIQVVFWGKNTDVQVLEKGVETGKFAKETTSW